MPIRKWEVQDITIVVSKVKEEDYTPMHLYNQIKKTAAFKHANTTLYDFILILDCLYALGQIELIGEEVIHYVGRN
mgnify:CR=1 FL=1